MLSRPMSEEDDTNRYALTLHIWERQPGERPCGMVELVRISRSRRNGIGDPLIERDLRLIGQRTWSGGLLDLRHAMKTLMFPCPVIARRMEEVVGILRSHRRLSQTGAATKTGEREPVLAY